MIKTDNDLQEILSQELDKMSKEYGDSFSVEKINLAELSRRTGISKQRLRRFKKNNSLNRYPPVHTILANNGSAALVPGSSPTGSIATPPSFKTWKAL